MDPQTIAAIITALSSLFTGGTPDTSVPAEAPAGAGAGGVTPGFSLPTPGADLNIGAILQDTGSQAGLQAPVAAAATPATVPLSAGAATPNASPAAPSPTIPIPETPPASIGEILAASPEALLAVAQLLGIGGQDQSTVRAAPAPGGTQGSIIPGLQLPQGNQLGALLQQIPGLR